MNPKREFFEDFGTCSFQPVSSDAGDLATCSLSTAADVKKDEGKSSSSTSSSWKTSSFYLDSSGRSSVPLLLQLDCSSEEILQEFISTKCCLDKTIALKVAKKDQDNNSNVAGDADAGKYNAFVRQAQQHYSFGIEAKVTLTYGSGEAITATVERVNIRSVEIVEEKRVIYFDTEVLVSVTRPEGFSLGFDEFDGYDNYDSKSSLEAEDYSFSQNVKTDLEISAVLYQKLPNENKSSLAREGLKALAGVGGFPDFEYGRGGSVAKATVSTLMSRKERIRQTKLNPPVQIQVSLTNALSIAAQSLPSPNAMGQTYVSVTMKHSNTHTEPVTVTKITLHSGHAKQKQQELSSMEENPPAAASAGAQGSSVTDMSKVVRWAFAPNCDPGLPITILPHEAYSTVLIIEASEDTCSRSFTSPLSVTAVVGGNKGSSSNGSESKEEDSNSNAFFSVVAGSEVYWTTSRAAVEPADAFRVDITIQEQTPGLQVGVPLTCQLDISNMSIESRDLMVLVDHNSASAKAASQASGLSTATTAKAANTGRLASFGQASGLSTAASSSPTSKGSQSPQKIIKRAVVSESAGRKFGIWGLLDNGLSSSEIRRDDTEGGLLTVDVALLLGEIKGNSIKRAEVRFIPLRAGTLTLPNFVIIDRRRGKWYDAAHNVRLVVQEGPNGETTAEPADPAFSSAVVGA